ncbi:MAG: hypothetical protein M5R40_18360 [Anaerolineae bacterium]|nr:hypothetical protein [Anaerolineae bacterium]
MRVPERRAARPELHLRPAMQLIGRTGLLMPLEQDGYLGEPTRRRIGFEPTGISARSGARGVGGQAAGVLPPESGALRGGGVRGQEVGHVPPLRPPCSWSRFV